MRTDYFRLLLLLVACGVIASNDTFNYINELFNFLTSLHRNIYTCDLNALELYQRRLEGHLDIFGSITQSVQRFQEQENNVEGYIVHRMITVYEHLNSVSLFVNNRLSEMNQIPSEHFHCRVLHGRVGRPKSNITFDQIRFCRQSLHMNWVESASTLGISNRTLRRHRLHVEYEEDNIVTDDYLDQQISILLQQTFNVGETYIIGGLRASGVRVTRERVRERLRILDPVGRAIRRRQAIQRRVYNVQCANALW